MTARRPASSATGCWREAAFAFVAIWRAILGDAGVLVMLFGAPVLYSLLYPLPYEREAVTRVPVMIVDQDRSSLSGQLVRYAMADPLLDVREVTPMLGAAQDRLWGNQVAGVMILPAGLGRDLLAGRPGVVTLAGDGAYLLLNKVVVGAMAEVTGTVAAGVTIRRLLASTPSPAQARVEREPVALNAVPLFNVREGYGSYIVPAVAVLIVQQTLLIGIGMMLGLWAEQRRPRPAATAPGFIGAWIAVGCVPLLTCAYYFGFVGWWQGYPRAGRFAEVATFSLVFALTLAAAALMLGLLFRSRERSALLLIGLSMPILFVAGVSWPVEALPGPLQGLRWLLPSTPGIEGFVALNQLGASLAEVRVELAVLLGQMAVFSAIAGWRWQAIARD